MHLTVLIMRKAYLVFAVIFLFHHSFAQTTNVFPANGKVGIGTTSPATILDVAGTITLEVAGVRVTNIVPCVAVNGIARTLQFNNTTGNALEGFQFNNAHDTTRGVNLMMIEQSGNIGIGAHNAKPLGILDIDQGAAGNGIIFSNHANSATVGSIMTMNYSRGTDSARASVSSTDRIGGFVFQAYDGINYIPSASIETFVSGAVSAGSVPTRVGLYTTPAGGTARIQRMNIDNSGNVGIGTTDTKGYMLGVNGTVAATSVTVQAYVNWADYVFKPNYKLSSLTEVEAYINKNHHLAEVPTTQEVAEKGLDLGKMNQVLIKKVEELTLYLIRQNKLIADQEKTTRSLQKQISELSKQRTARKEKK